MTQSIVTSPLFSIVVPSYNQARFLDETLSSLLGQEDADIEVLVVDGGSTDGSVDIIRRYADRLAWWVSEPDRGQSHALNKGFQRASGEWLGWLNSDDFLLPGALQILRTQLGRNPACRWWIGEGWFVDADGRRLRRYSAPLGLERPEQLSDWREHWLSQPASIFRRSLWLEVGGAVREDLHYAMDLDLWLRFLKRAAPTCFAGDFAGYRVHTGSKTQRLAVTGEMEIVRVLAEHLGLDAALDRVRLIAEEREGFRERFERLDQALKPIMSIRALARGMLKKVFR